MRALALRPLWICLLVALVARLVFAFCLFPIFQERWHLREDGDDYGSLAQAMREGHYDDVTRGPVYPAFLAIAGSPAMAKFLQALLDTGTCVLVFLIAHRNWKAAALWAVYPFAIWRVGFISKEIVATFLLTAYVCIQLLALRNGKIRAWLAAGGLLALANLCKPTFLAWPIAVLALVFLHRVPLTRVAALLAGMVIVIAPWTWRNYVVTHGAFLPVATERGGVTTFIGNYQPTLGLWEGPGKPIWLQATEEIKQQHADASVVELDHVYYAAAWKEITHNPLKATEIWLRKCVRFWCLGAKRREVYGSVIIQLAYLAAMGVGLHRRWPWDLEVVLMLSLIVYVMLIHALTYADLRFSIYVMPFVCVLASGLFQTRDRSTELTAAAAA
jgi:hypothetical protein